jgi:hypothetical protein
MAEMYVDDLTGSILFSTSALFVIVLQEAEEAFLKQKLELQIEVSLDGGACVLAHDRI